MSVAFGYGHFYLEAAFLLEKPVDKLIYRAMFKSDMISRPPWRPVVRDAYGLEKIYGVLSGSCDHDGECC